MITFLLSFDLLLCTELSSFSFEYELKLISSSVLLALSTVVDAIVCIYLGGDCYISGSLGIIYNAYMTDSPGNFWPVQRTCNHFNNSILQFFVWS